MLRNLRRKLNQAEKNNDIVTANALRKEIIEVERQFRQDDLVRSRRRRGFTEHPRQ